MAEDEKKEDYNDNENIDQQSELKKSWAEFGKGMGKSFGGLGKSILKSVKVGLDGMDGTVTDEEKAELKSSWKDVGHNFGHTGASLGKAAARTADKVADSIEPEDKSKN